MKEFSTFWKIFRFLCIVQLILVAFLGMQSLGMFFSGAGILLSFININAYALMFWFVYHGLSILNYNYPDTPLSAKQKRIFNVLYVINFVLISFLFAQVVNNWWRVRIVFNSDYPRNYAYYFIAAFLFISWLIFIIHLITLAGMFRLRRSIHENTINTWYDQFDQQP